MSLKRFKKNDLVEYIGCSQEQILWGNNDDPRSYLILGNKYRVEKVEVHSYHTKIKLYNKVGLYNSVCFELLENDNSSNLQYIKNMDSSSIELEDTSKLFEYEMLSREIENCNDITTLKEMCRCFIKLHFKQQEVASEFFKNK